MLNKNYFEKEIKEGDGNNINNEENKINDNKKEDKKCSNFIFGKIKIKDELNQRIINSYENMKNEYKNWDWDNIRAVNNEEDIKNCEIFINGKKIKFDYFYKFPFEGEFAIIYKFQNILKSTNFMFANCNSISFLDFSNFDSTLVTNMRSMFNNCESLVSINLPNFETKKVTNMAYYSQGVHHYIH